MVTRCDLIMFAGPIIPEKVEPVYGAWVLRSVVIKLAVVISILLSIGATAEQVWVEYYKGRAGVHYYDPKSIKKIPDRAAGSIIQIEMLVNAPAETPFYHYHGQFQSMKTIYWVRCEYSSATGIERGLYQYAFAKGRRGPTDRPAIVKKWEKVKNGSPMDKLRKVLCRDYL